MYRYAQIDSGGYVVSDSHLSGAVEADNMVPIDDDFDLVCKRYVGGKWEEYTPEPIGPEPTEPDGQDIVQAQLLLNQADIIARQQEQDEVLAAILLNQMGGGEDV